MKLLNAMLARIVRTGTLEVVDAEGTVHRHAGTPQPYVRVKLHDPALYTALAWNPDLKAGEAYMDGTLTIEDGTLRDFLTLFAINRGIMLTPFHNMALMSPFHTLADVDRHTEVFAEAVATLLP